MQPRKIVLTKFPFTDLSCAKRRPALVIAQSKSNDTDFIVSFISSVIPEVFFETDYTFNTTEKEFSQSGLAKNSVFKMDKIATLDKEIFTGELGEISDELFQKLKMKLKIALDL